MTRHVVLDTNCLVMAIPRRSPYHRILLDLLAGKYVLCISNEIILEYEEILTRKMGRTIAGNIVNALLASSFTKYICPQQRYHLITADPDDNKFVDCAIEAHAQYIVTQDRHYEALKHQTDYAFSIVDIDRFLTLLS